MINSKQLGRVALLVGGQSPERSISLVSGKRIGEALTALGVTFEKIDVGEDIIARLQAEKFDRAFIALHGQVGEDGMIQSLLELMQIPYTGPSVLSCALAMDKIRTKLIWQAVGIPTPPFCRLEESEKVEAFIEQYGFPLIVKPIYAGSSWGVSKVMSREELPEAMRNAQAYGPSMMEYFVEGDEFTVGIVGRDVLPVLRLRAARDVCDFDAKYCDDATKHEFFVLKPEVENQVKALSLKAFDAMDGYGTARIDWMQDKKTGDFYALEMNAIPGMTYTSMLPDAAEANGWSFGEFCLRILASAKCHSSGLKPSEHGKLGKKVLQKQGLI